MHFHFTSKTPLFDTFPITPPQHTPPKKNTNTPQWEDITVRRNNSKWRCCKLLLTIKIVCLHWIQYRCLKTGTETKQSQVYLPATEFWNTLWQAGSVLYVFSIRTWLTTQSPKCNNVHAIYMIAKILNVILSLICVATLHFLGLLYGLLWHTLRYINQKQRITERKTWHTCDDKNLLWPTYAQICIWGK